MEANLVGLQWSELHKVQVCASPCLWTLALLNVQIEGQPEAVAGAAGGFSGAA